MVSLPTTGDPILQEPSRVLLHQRPHGAFLHVGGFGWPGCGPRTGSCCCSCCSSAISVGEYRWSGPPRTASVPDSSATLSQCLLTAPLHCLPVPPDSSATLSLGRCVTLLLPILLAGVGKQVGSMDEEPQVRGCYNITFICTPTNQETV